VPLTNLSQHLDKVRIYTWLPWAIITPYQTLLAGETCNDACKDGARSIAATASQGPLELALPRGVRASENNMPVSMVSAKVEVRRRMRPHGDRADSRSRRALQKSTTA
jgi:hypothetical protein